MNKMNLYEVVSKVNVHGGYSYDIDAEQTKSPLEILNYLKANDFKNAYDYAHWYNVSTSIIENNYDVVYHQKRNPVLVNALHHLEPNTSSITKIKVVRALTGCGLAEAKRFVDEG